MCGGDKRRSGENQGDRAYLDADSALGIDKGGVDEFFLDGCDLWVVCSAADETFERADCVFEV